MTKQQPKTQEEKLILKLYATHSYRQIAKETGLTVGSVANLVRRLGLTGTKTPPKKDKKKPKIKKPEVKKIEFKKETEQYKKSVEKTSATKASKEKTKRLIRVKLKETEILNMPSFIEKRDIENIPSRHRCKYIYGDVKNENARWCRKPTTKGTSWCKDHLKLIYRRPYSYENSILRNLKKKTIR